MLRGQSQRTAYRSVSPGSVLTHHIDDGRAVGKKVPMDILLAHLAEHVLLKVSEPINAGGAFSYLTRTRIRRPLSWVLIPDPEHLANMFELVGYNVRKPGRSVTTPGVNRVGDMSLGTELEPDDAAKFRSATGS